MDGHYPGRLERLLHNWNSFKDFLCNPWPHSFMLLTSLIEHTLEHLTAFAQRLATVRNITAIENKLDRDATTVSFPQTQPQTLLW